MQVDLKAQHTETHYWITIFWCAVGAVIIGAIAVISYWIRRCRKVKHLMKKLHKQNGLKRSNSAIEFDVSALTAANRRHLYTSNRSASSEQDNSEDHSEHSEKSPLVSARLDNLARLFFSKSMPAESGSRDTIESVLTTRPNLKYQYSALDSGNGVVERSPRERANRERALNATQDWIQNSNGRYEVIAHLDEIGSRHGKNWFLVTDSSVRTDRLLTLLPLPPDCIAFEDLPTDENPKVMLMELLGSLHHPYVYPVLDLGFLHTNSKNASNFACLVTPFNSRGSLKDLIYKAQWNEPWARKYTRKPNGLPVTQVQRLGRQILEALLFLKERGFPLHGHLHSGNIILQNGAARLSGLENGLLGLSSRINAVMWSRSTTDIENVDIICFGHLIYEMCMGQEMTTPKPSMRVLEMELEHYPQILDILGLIFEPPSGVCPSVEDLVLCDLFRSIDLRELRGPCFSTIKPSLSRSTLNLLHAVKKRQCASLGNSFSEASSPCTPPTTPHERRSGTSRTMDSFDISSDSEEGLLDEIIVGGIYPHKHLQQLQLMRYYQQQHHRSLHHLGASTSSSGAYQPRLPSPLTQYYDPMESPIHYCDNANQSDDNSCGAQENHQPHRQQQPMMRCHSSTISNNTSFGAAAVANLSRSFDESSTSGEAKTTATINSRDTEDNTISSGQLGLSVEVDAATNKELPSESAAGLGERASGTHHNGCSFHASTSGAAASFNHQLTADICNYKNSKSRRLEYSLKCLKYGRSNPSQDSAFGSLTDNDLSIGSSSFRISSFQSISSPIDEGVEDIIIATTTAGHETCLELATIPHHMISQDSAISSPCRETSPSNFLNIDEVMLSSCSGASSSSGSTGNLRPQQFPVSLSPKILVTATTNSSNSSLSSSTGNAVNQQHQQQQQQQFDPPKILVNDQNSIYTTSPSKRSGPIEVFSQKYRVSSFEDMSPNKSSSNSDKHIKNVNRIAFRSLEEERRIDSAFMPIADRTHSENRVNMQSEKYKKLTHSSFRISKTSSQVMYDTSPGALTTSTPGSSTMISNIDMPRPATASGSTSSRTLWRDSKFYRKNRIAKSNDSLLETSPNHSVRLSPSSLRDNHYDSCSSYGSRSHSRQSLNRGGSINEIRGSNQTIGIGLTVSSNFFGDTGSHGRRYCSSKSEDLGETKSDYLRVMDVRKSYSERHLLTLKQTAINNVSTSGSEQCCFSEDEMSFNDDNNRYGYQHQQEKPHQAQYQQKRQRHHHQQSHEQGKYLQQHQQQYPKRPHPNQLSWSSTSINRLKTTNIKTTSLATLSCQQNLPNAAVSTHITAATGSSSDSSIESKLLKPDFKLLKDELIEKPGASGGSEENSSTDDSPSHLTLTLSGAELSRIFAMDDARASSCSEEKTPLLDSVEMSPISPTEPEKPENEEQM